MAMTGQEISDLLRAGLQDADVKIEDLRGDGDHYAAHIVSPAFK